MPTVYRFEVYDVTTDEMRLSRRMATADAAARARGSIIEGTALEVPDTDLGAEVPGMTARDYWLLNSGDRGFQRSVRTAPRS